MDFGHLILIAGYVFNLLLIAFILFFEENPASHRVAWILAIGFIPVAGPFLYVLLSGNFFTRTKRMIRATQKANGYYRRLLTEQHRDLERRDAGAYGSLIHMNLLYGKSPVLANNTVDVFREGEAKYAALFAEFARAKESIHISYFIVENDQTGRELIEILARKAAEGVRVRFLYDHVGSFFTSSRLFKPLRRAGGEVSRFFPVSLINPFSVNYRNHRKIAVIDGRVGYFGGMNIGDEYANRNGARKYYWRDTHVRITGPAVQILQKQFLVDWYSSTSKADADIENIAVERFFPAHGAVDEADLPLPALSRTVGVPMQIVTAGPDDTRNDEIRDAMIHMITSAKKSVFIETPYFTPDAAFYTVLKIAALSGIDVRIIVPGEWDKFYVKLAAMPYIGDLLSYGVRFYRYSGFIHSKMVVIDGVLATIGSTNVDTRSFSLHFELNAFFYSPEFGRKCADEFLADQKASTEVSAASFARVPVLKRAVWNFFKLFAPLM